VVEGIFVLRMVELRLPDFKIILCSRYHPDVVYLNYQTKEGKYGRVLMNETDGE